MLDPERKDLTMDYLKAAAMLSWMPILALMSVVIYHWMH